MTEQTTSETPLDLDDSIRFRISSNLKKALQIQALTDDEDMSDVLRRLIQQYLDSKKAQ